MLSISLETISNNRLDIVKSDKESKFNLYIEEMEYKQLTLERVHLLFVLRKEIKKTT